MNALSTVSALSTKPEFPELRKAVDQVVGSVFYGTMLRTMRASTMKGPYGHGGRGEEVFQGQLDQLIAERAGQAQRYSLNEAIYSRLAEQQGRMTAVSKDRSEPL